MLSKEKTRAKDRVTSDGFGSGRSRPAARAGASPALANGRKRVRFASAGRAAPYAASAIGFSVS